METNWKAQVRLEMYNIISQLSAGQRTDRGKKQEKGMKQETKQKQLL